MKTLTDLLGHLIPLSQARLGSADVHEQLSDLVGVHARCRELDRSSPVVVVVAQGEGELLHSLLLQA